MGVIFDLDQTLVDTKFIESYRNNRDWVTVRRLINQVRPYVGIDDIIQKLRLNNIPVAIVTNSPSFYLDLILNHLNWSIQYKVCYHDIPKGFHKPHYLPIQRAIEGLNVSKSSTYSFGDRDIDITASKGAQVKAIGCLWGSDNHESLRQSNPDIILSTISELNIYIQKEFNI